MRGQLPERGHRIGHGDQVPGKGARAIGGDQRRDGAALERCGDEIMAVEALAFERHEQIPGRKRAGVGGHALETHVAADDASVHGPGGGRRIHHAPLHAASTASTTRASEKWWRTPFFSW